MSQKIFLLLIVFLIPLVSGANYDIIVEESGNALVLIELQGPGLVNLPVQSDVEDFRVRGALYIFENNSAEISIGPAETAYVLYKTSMLTTKQGSTWSLSFPLGNTTGEKVTVSLPLNTIIKATSYSPFINNQEYTEIIWQGDFSRISINYEFPKIIEPILEEKNYPWGLILFGVILILVIIGFAFIPKKSKKGNVVKTLSGNEKIIIKIMLENKGSIKRNILERKSSLAKSSLANTLRILERKKIIEIDKTWKTHFIKFTRWFNEL